ncbi:hypothetical protein SALBM135S_06819 [Streptomyces alboniger]
MTGFGRNTREHPRSRGRTWPRSGPDRATLETAARETTTTDAS